MEELPEIIAQIEHKTLPLVTELISETTSSFEYLDNALSMMSYLTYAGDSISPAMWGLCGPLLQALETWAYDYISNISVPLVNYITRVRK